MRLGELADARPPVLVSALYETEPVGCEPNAPRFYNAVLETGYEASADELLRELRRIEAALGRQAGHTRNTSRKLDLDLLYFGEALVSKTGLELPHPRAHERRFVLEPLNDIRPDLVLPLQSENVASLLRCLPETEPLVRVASRW